MDPEEEHWPRLSGLAEPSHGSVGWMAERGYTVQYQAELEMGFVWKVFLLSFVFSEGS